MSGELTWVVRSPPAGLASSVNSSVFQAGKHQWNLCLNPHKGDHCAVFLYCVDACNSNQIPDWQCKAKFTLSLVNQVHPLRSITHAVGEHLFTARAASWGFPSFVLAADVANPSKGFFKEDCFILTAKVEVIEASPTLSQPCVSVYITTDEDMHQQIGSSVFFELVDFSKVQHQLRAPAHVTFMDFKHQAAAVTGIPEPQQRWWTWDWRENKTYRPSKIVIVKSDKVKLSGLCSIHANPEHEPLQAVWLLERRPEPPSSSEVDLYSESSMQLFFKYYDPSARSLSYKGHMHLRSSTVVEHMVSELKRWAGLSAGADVKVWEEKQHQPSVQLELLEPEYDLDELDLDTGSILIFEASWNNKDPPASELRSAQHFLEAQISRVQLKFCKLAQPKSEGIIIELPRISSYQDVCKALAEKLKLQDSDLIRLTGHRACGSDPMPYPIRHGADNVLAQVKWGCDPDCMFYEVLSLPLPEIQAIFDMHQGRATVEGTPAEYLCPITHAVFEDPVFAADGYTFERAAILRWFKMRDVVLSPMTNEELEHTEVISNHALRSAIRQWQGR